MTTLTTEKLKQRLIGIDRDAPSFSGLRQIFTDVNTLFPVLQAEAVLDRSIHGGPPIEVSVKGKPHSFNRGVNAILRHINAHPGDASVVRSENVLAQ